MGGVPECLLVWRCVFGRWIQCGKACDAEEKIDGANLGISVDTLSGAIRFQKRGHWIAPTSEPQYGKLEAWSNNHKEALSRALGKLPAGWQCGTPCPCRPKHAHACVSVDPQCFPSSRSSPCLIPPHPPRSQAAPVSCMANGFVPDTRWPTTSCPTGLWRLMFLTSQPAAS